MYLGAVKLDRHLMHSSAIRKKHLSLVSSKQLRKRAKFSYNWLQPVATGGIAKICQNLGGYLGGRAGGATVAGANAEVSPLFLPQMP
jgi:hypothetical protein